MTDPTRPIIYIADPDQAFTALLAGTLEAAGFRTQSFNSAQTLRDALDHPEGKPAALILNLNFCTTRDEHTLSPACFQLVSELPSIVVSATDNLTDRLAALRAGAKRYLVKPVNPDKLADMVTGMLHKKPSSPYRILLIDDDELLLEYHALALQSAGMSTHQVSDPSLALQAIEHFQPDVILMDVYMPICSGMELAAIIRADDRYTHIPMIFLSTEGSYDKQMEILKQAGDEFLCKPLEIPYLISVAQARARHSRHLRRISGELRASLRELGYQKQALDQHAIVSITDIAGRITYANDKFCDISGYARAELLGQNHRLIKSGIHPASLYQEMWRAIRSGQTWHGEICNRRKNGELYWVASTIVPFLDEQQQPYQYVSIRTDITERKRVEERLEASERRLRLGQTYANIGTWDWNIQTGELYWSERIGPLFGYPEGKLETTYENFLNAVHPDDRQRVIDAVNACVEKGEDYNIEHRIVWPDGSLHWAQERGDVARAADGKPMRMIGVVQDITERVETEIKLRESEERFSFAVAGAGDGIWDWNMVTGEMPFSGHYEEMLGFAKGELEPTIDGWVKSVHPDDLARAQQNLKAYLEGQVPVYAIELQLRCKDGGYKWILCRGTVVARDDMGNPVRMIGIHTDISERKAVEMELVEAREAAERANQAKSEFLSSMSHELRTPLNAILGFGQLLESDPTEPLTSGQKDSMDQIIKAGWHLLSLINEVLDLAKIEAGHIDLSIEPVELAEIVDECLSLTTPLAAKRSIRLNKPALPAPDIATKADRTRLKQILLNLLSNAVKYNREQGSITLSVERVANESVRISVTDTGNGLDAEQQKGLFQAFNRLGAERTTIEGTGIGLVISKRIVEMMGGAIGVESTPGVGSTFWIELDEPTHSERTSIPDDLPELQLLRSDHTTQYLVLYVEDNPANLKLVSQILAKRSDIKLITAHTGTLGLDFALAHRPDLILLDINLPGMDGYEIKAHLQAQEATRHIPVLAISANAMPRDIEKGLAAGFLKYITKPIDIRALLAAIDDTLHAASTKK